MFGPQIVCLHSQFAVTLRSRVNVNKNLGEKLCDVCCYRIANIFSDVFTRNKIIKVDITRLGVFNTVNFLFYTFYVKNKN